MDQSTPSPLRTAHALFGDWLAAFGAAVERRDPTAVAALFAADGYWRDILAFTWEHRTFAGPAEIADAFAATSGRTGMRNVRIAHGRAAPQLIRRSGRDLVEGYFEFETAVGHGVGFVRLMNDPSLSGSPIWMLLTTLHDLRGFEEKVGERRPTGDEFSQIVSPVSWGQVREREKAFEDRQPQVVIIGAGQGGLMLGARLRQMGVDALILEKTARVGDGWRQRYNNLTLHNELAANHFPYMPFPQTWPCWLPKDMVGAWLESYAEFMELNVWTSSQVEQAKFDEASGQWGIRVRRGDGSVRALSPKHLVLASGVSGGAPRRGNIPGIANFAGKVIHSSEFQTGAEWAGKKAIVIGTGNSGHDVAQDLHVSGCSVSLLQRGATCVVSLDPSARMTYSIYAEGRSVDDADLMAAAIPYPVLHSTYQWVTKLTNRHDEDLIRRLNAAGFKTYDGADGTGFQFLYLRGAGGYYIDVGCSELIADGRIPVLQHADSEGFVADGLKMKDGRVIPADLVVLATGFEGMETSVRKLLGDEVADRVGPIWGFDQDGVMRNMWRRTAQHGLWMMGGAIIEARLHSRFLALEILASLQGLLPPRQDMPLVRRKGPVTASQPLSMRHPAPMTNS